MNAKKVKPAKDGKKGGGDKTAETKSSAQSADSADSSASAKAAKAADDKAKGGGEKSDSESAAESKKSGGDEKDSTPAGGDNGGEDSSPLDPLEAYSAEELREMVRLAAADKENILRRAENEIRKARDFAVQTFAADICEVRDCLEAAKADEEKNGGKASQGVILGLRKLCVAMEKHGIRPIAPDIGATFDSALHYAVGMSEGYETSKIIAEVKQCGYTLNGRLVRPAIVWLGKPPANEKDSESKTAPGKSGGE